jgi:hypothetical protein
MTSWGTGAFASAHAPWSWRVAGTLSRSSACSKAGERAVGDVCRYQVSNPSQARGTVTGVVTATNTSDRRTCYGVSLSTAYMAGLQSFCVRAKSTGRWVTSGPASHYRDTQVSVFVTSGSTTVPIQPLGDPHPSPFTISFSERR